MFVTGEFKSSSQPVNFVEDFDEEQMLGLEHWRLFYAEHVAYPYVGRVFGSGFFDEHGEETPLLKKINNVIKVRHISESLSTFVLCLSVCLFLLSLSLFLCVRHMSHG